MCSLHLNAKAQGQLKSNDIGLLKFVIFNCMYLYMYVYLCIGACASKCPQKPEQCVGSQRAGVWGSCELPNKGTELGSPARVNACNC